MLRIAGVSYRYRDAPTPALHEVSLEIPGGGIFGLLGPNGAGKTTLISLLAGLLTATNGQISLHGQPLAAVRAANTTACAPSLAANNANSTPKPGPIPETITTLFFISIKKRLFI